MPCILTRRFCRETLYGVGRVPSDTRERLDEPRQLRHCFTKLFQILQRGKELDTYGNYVLRRNRIFFIGQSALSKLL